jgi:hypothetical protein
MRQPARLLILAVGFVLMALSITEGWLPSGHHIDGSDRLLRFALRAACFAIGIGLVWSHVSWWAWLNPRSLASNVRVRKQNNAEMGRLITDLLSSTESIELGSDDDVELAKMLTQPSAFRSRVVEHVHLKPDRVARTISVEFSLPTQPLIETTSGPPANTHGAEILVIARRRKGQLIDNFSCQLADGRGALMLPHAETSQLLGRLALSLMNLVAVESKSVGRDHARRLNWRFKDQIRLLAVILSGPDKAAGAHEKIVRRLIKHRADRLPSADVFLRLLDAVSSTYPLLVVVPRDAFTNTANRRYVVVKYRYTESFSKGSIKGVPDDQPARVRNWLRAVTLSKPTQFSVPSPKALSSKAYHLRVTAPNSYHIADQRLIDSANGGQPIPVTSPGHVTTPYIRLDRLAYQPSTQLYVTGLSQDSRLEPQLVVRIAENLPGSLGRAAASAGAVSLAIWFAGTVANPHHSASSTTVDLLPFLLAIPAIAASWTGLIFTGDRVYSSLVSRLSILSSTVLSLCAVVLYLAEEAKLFTDPASSHWGLANLNTLYWSILLFITLSNLAWVLTTLVIRMLRRPGFRSHRK